MPYIDFSALKTRVSIEQAADVLGLPTKPEGHQLRTACAACNQGGDRAIVITPAKGLFYCFSSKKGGDCIGLAAHVLGVKDAEAAQYLASQLGIEGDSTVNPIGNSTVSKPRARASTSPEGRTAPAHQPTAQPASTTKQTHFDPVKFAGKLAYADEVANLGISEADAQALGIGYHPQRKQVYFPIRHEDGSIAGFIGFVGQLRLPPQWLPPSNVVRLRRA